MVDGDPVTYLKFIFTAGLVIRGIRIIDGVGGILGTFYDDPLGNPFGYLADLENHQDQTNDQQSGNGISEGDKCIFAVGLFEHLLVDG